jgi:hypothetical protein
MNTTNQPPRQDRVYPLTRFLAAVIIPFLLAAFLILYLTPGQSGVRFAWPIKPAMTAMMLGATYLGGVYFFGRVLFARQWHTVRLGFIPVTTFAALMGVSTLLHWDRFTHGSLAFQLWAVLYFTTPFIVPLVWALNQRQNPDPAASAEPRFSRPLTLAVGGLGAVLTVVSLLLFLFPSLMIPTWPWTLTPLTARAMAAMFSLAGLVGLGVAIDPRWSSAGILFQSQALPVVLILLAMLPARPDIAWSNPSSWFFIGGMLLVLALIAWAALESRGGSPARKADPAR